MAKENYLEAHVTIEPVFEEDFARLDWFCKTWGFSRAELLMQKRKTDTPERSKYDTFCTARSYDEQDIADRVEFFVTALTMDGFKVWRYKIERTLLDSRYNDVFELLDPANLPEKELNPRSPV